MQCWLSKPPCWFALTLTLVSAPAMAAPEIGVVTLVEGEARLLRGATWYKLVAGARVEEGDIVEVPDRAQAQLEFTAGTTAANLVGAGSLYVMPPVKSSPSVLVLPNGWLKVAAKAPGVRVRTALFDVMTAEGIVVIHAQGLHAEFFVEAGSVKFFELSASGADGPARDAMRGEYWAKSATGAFASVPRAPRTFVDAMPRHFTDPLPAFAARIKSKPALAIDHEITYAEAEPWLAGRDRAAFERRFATRLRDPAFRKAVEPVVARYPSWDRLLHPEKFAPKPAPVTSK
jgi:hypothetical protein